MNADQVCDAALARCAEWTPAVPSTRSVMFHRINARQQQLFSYVADREPEYFGRSAVKALVAGAVDLGTLNPKAERVTDIRIEDPGTSALVTKDRVNVVPVMDVGAADVPRATLRDFILEQVDTDLALVTSLRIHYSKRPASIVNGTTTIELMEQFQELLVIDLTKHIIRKTLELSGENRELIVKILDEEEVEAMADLDRHLTHWRYAETARFEHSQTPAPRPLR